VGNSCGVSDDTCHIVPQINLGVIHGKRLRRKEIQRIIVAQIAKEQELVNASKQLIEIFEKKIKDRIAKVWGK